MTPLEAEEAPNPKVLDWCDVLGLSDAVVPVNSVIPIDIFGQKVVVEMPDLVGLAGRVSSLGLVDLPN